MGNKSWMGLDGQRYETSDEMLGANNRYRQQEEQKRLLEEQNRLIAQQNQINEKNKLKEMIAQYKQMEHEEEMRILKLCDDVGITKEAIDSFEEYLFTPPKELVNMKKEIDDKYNDPDEEIANAKSYLLKDDTLILKNYFRLFPPIYELKKQLSYEREEEIKEQFLEWIDKPEEYTKELTKIDAYDTSITLKKEEKTKMVNIIVVIVCIVLLVLILSYNANAKQMGDIATGISYISVLTLPLVIIYCFYKMFKDDKITKLQKKLETRFTDMKYVETLKLNKIKPKEVLKNHIEEIEKELNNFHANFTEYYNNITDKWNNFIEFRKKHYNSKVEKLLIDVGIKDTVLNLGLEYPKINVNNKKKDGSVEDYIAYFDEVQN